MVRAASRKLNNWGMLVAMVAVSACAFTAQAGAAGTSKTSPEGTDVPPVYGGTQYYETPKISALQCQAGCTRAAKVSQTGWVSVKEKGVLRIRGLNMDSVGKVLFVGASGKADNVGVVPTTQTSRAVDVKVPQLANNGKIVLLDPAGHSSKPSDAAPAHPARSRRGQRPGLMWPLPVKGMITGVFGENRGDHMHTGLDIAVPPGRASRRRRRARSSSWGRRAATGTSPASGTRAGHLLRAPVGLSTTVRRLRSPGPDDRPRGVHRQLLGPAPALRGAKGPRRLVLADGPDAVRPARR